MSNYTESILQFFRQQNRTFDVSMNERLSAQINDLSFENYPSLGDLFYLIFEHRRKDGGDSKQHMMSITSELNEVVASIFDNYTIEAIWDQQLGAPKILIKKGQNITIPLEGLSLGEQEILSLAGNIFAGIDSEFFTLTPV